MADTKGTGWNKCKAVLMQCMKATHTTTELIYAIHVSLRVFFMISFIKYRYPGWQLLGSVIAIGNTKVFSFEEEAIGEMWFRYKRNRMEV
jgi:hypothetical protein